MTPDLVCLVLLPRLAAAATRRTDRNKTARFTYTHSNHTSMGNVLSAQKRENNKWKLAAASKQKHIQKKQAPASSTAPLEAPQKPKGLAI